VTETGEKGYVPATYVQMIEPEDEIQQDREADIDSEPVPAADESESAEDQEEVSQEEETSHGTDESENETEDNTDSGASDTDSEASQKSDHIQTLLMDLQKRKSRTRRKHIPPPLQPIDPSLPLGFRPSTLYQCVQSGITSAEFLTPELHSHGLSFKDLHYDSKHMVRKRDVKCCLAFTVSMGKWIPIAGDLDVLGRHVRISLFDKSHILSNVHSVPAQLTDDQGTWTFQMPNKKWFQDEEGCFVRTDEVDIKLCLLFELCLVVKSKPSTSPTTAKHPDDPQVEEISCGWCMLPLYTIDGNPLEPKSYEMVLFGGTPYDHDVELAPSPTKTSFLGRLSSKTRVPKLVVKVWKMKKRLKRQLEYSFLTVVIFLICFLEVCELFLSCHCTGKPWRIHFLTVPDKAH
jgi:hypothetical protein